MSGTTPQIVAVDRSQIDDLLRRAEQQLDAKDFQLLRTVIEAYAFVVRLLEDKKTSLGRLRKLLFGAATEKTAAIVGRSEATAAEQAVSPPADANSADANAADAAQPTSPDAPAPRKGHGRRGAEDFPGAARIVVSHPSLQAGDACPECATGTVYNVAQPGVLLRFVGQPPIQATVYELAKLRCGLCGKVFTAPAPADVGEEKYDATVASMIGVLKYGSGMPFNRLDRLQGNLAIPLPASTQWEIVESALPKLTPAFEELIRQAAQGEVLYNDDTTVKILEWMGKRAQQQAFAETTVGAGAPPARKGLFTSGVVATGDGFRIALFFSGRQHAGENLRDVLRQRASERPPPIQMCDALSRNRPPELETILANCLAHGRRRFVDLNDRFPDECRYVLESLELVYHNDALARQENLTPAERLSFHQAHSGPRMADLRAWLSRQFDERLVEPNSGLGAAISYLRKHWEKLTLFLRVAGAPLDNNLCERALKKAILHRKNALFYKTQNGAAAGDLYMSLIYTCELCGANPFDYLTELQRHAASVAAAPQHWMPWSYQATLAASQAAAG